jgi:hypothetical protein
MNELRVIDEMGQAYPIQDITAEHLKKLSDEDLEQLAYAFKFLEKPVKEVSKEYKERVKNGSEMWKSSLKVSTKKEIPNSQNNKEAFFRKYGLDAFDIKSPTKLKEAFGQRVEEDIDKVVLKTEVKTVRWN